MQDTLLIKSPLFEMIDAPILSLNKSSVLFLRVKYLSMLLIKYHWPCKATKLCIHHCVLSLTIMLSWFQLLLLRLFLNQAILGFFRVLELKELLSTFRTSDNIDVVKWHRNANQILSIKSTYDILFDGAVNDINKPRI